MKALALDISLNSTGWYFDEENFGVLKMKASFDRFTKLKLIFDNIQEIVNRLKPEVIVIEDYSYGSSHSREIAGEAGGAVKLALYDFRHIPVYKLPIQTWKKVLLGKGNAGKDDIAVLVKKIFNKVFDDNNITDAFCLRQFVDHPANIKLLKRVT